MRRGRRAQTVTGTVALGWLAAEGEAAARGVGCARAWRWRWRVHTLCPLAWRVEACRTRCCCECLRAARHRHATPTRPECRCTLAPPWPPSRPPFDDGAAVCATFPHHTALARSGSPERASPSGPAGGCPQGQACDANATARSRVSWTQLLRSWAAIPQRLAARSPAAGAHAPSLCRKTRSSVEFLVVSL